MTYAITFALHAPFPLLNKQLRMHYRTRKNRQRQLMHEIAEQTRGRRPVQPVPFALIRVERYSVGTPDLDGLYGGVKALLDCLTTPRATKPRTVFGKASVRNPMGLSFVVDDDPAHILLEVVHVKATRALQRTVVTIEEVARDLQVAA